MSFGSHAAGDAVVLKFDMHVYTSVLTSDEVKNLAEEYAIPSDLHPCVPPSDLTMNRLPVDKIDSSVADPPPTGVRAEDIRRLCEHVIDLRPVHPAMLYAVGLTTIWKHVGHHPVFKDGEGNGSIIVLPLFAYVTRLLHFLLICLVLSFAVATSVFEFLKFPMAGGVRVGKGTALAANEVIPQHSTPPLPSGDPIPEKIDHQKVIEFENERVLAAKRKTQAAKDRAAGERSAAEGASRHTKKRKIALMYFALDESKGDDSTRTGSRTHPLLIHSMQLFWMMPIPQLAKVAWLQSRLGMRKKMWTLRHDKEDAQGHKHASSSSGHMVSSFGGSARRIFPHWNPGGDGDGSSLQGEATQPSLFFKLGRGALAQINLLQRYEALSDDYGDLYDSHRSCEEVSDRLTETQNQLIDTIRSQNQLRIKQLEGELASKTSSLSEAESSVNELKGDLERLTVDLSQAEIVRHNYVRQLFPTVFQRLLSSNEYKRSLSDVFNQDIAAGWSEGLKIERTQEEVEAILAVVTDHNPHCKDTFMDTFDSLFTRSYPYVEKLTESFRLPLRDLQNPWPEGFMRHLAIDTWTHPERPAFRDLCVTWPLALGLIRNVLRSGIYTSLGHWHLDSSRTSCVPGFIRHLAIRT
ncbi:hypothetical protein Tco_1000663 [Tanacetum coccineum]